MENIYEKLDNSVNRSNLIHRYIAAIKSDLYDAKTQAENGSELGMAVAVGRASVILSNLDDLIDSIITK